MMVNEKQDVSQDGVLRAVVNRWKRGSIDSITNGITRSMSFLLEIVLYAFYSSQWSKTDVGTKSKYHANPHSRECRIPTYQTVLYVCAHTEHLHV